MQSMVQDVPPDDERRSGSQCPRAFDEQPRLDHQDLAPDHARGRRPAYDRDRNDRRLQARAHHQAQDDRERKPRDDEEEIGRARQDLVRDAAVEAADQPNQGAQDHGDRGGGAADQQRNPAAVDEEGEDVPPLVVGSQDVGIRWRVERGCSLDGGRIRPGDQGREDRHGEEHEDDDRPRERESIPEQLAKEYLESIEIVQDLLAQDRQFPRLADPRRDVHASRTLGSRYMYRMSEIAFATTTPSVAMKKIADMSGKSRALVASHVNLPSPWKSKTTSITMAPLTTHPK